MLIITICKMWNAIGCYPVTKSHQNHQVPQRERLPTLVTFLSEVSDSSNHRQHVVCLMAASQRFQIAKVANFPTSLPCYSCITMGRESSIHNACYCASFQGSDETRSMLLRNACRAGRGGKG